MTHEIRLVEPSRAVLLLVILLVASNVHQTASCTDDQFQCNSSRCISKHLTCDGENDCGDFSDEINCTFRGKCNSDEFVCSEGSCISSTLVCNGKWDCPRGLDETNCASKTTAPITPPFEQLGLFQTADGKIKSFPVYEKSQGISIYLRFTAYKCAGHLFEMTSQNTDQFFLLSLTGNGNLEFLFKTSSGPGMVVIPPPPGDSFCNGKRHMLSVRRYLDELRFRVNRKRSITKRIGLLRESFSRPFRVYVGMTLEGCVSGIDVIFYRTRSKTYSVGYSRGCAKPKKTTPILPRETTASTLSLVSPTLRTRVRKESVIHKSNTPFPTSEVSKQGTFTLGTTVTQRKEVTHSLPVTHPASISGSFTRGYISQGAQTPRMSRQSEATRASTNMPTTQSEDVMDPYLMDQGTITSTYPKSSLVTKHTTSSTSLSPTVTHSSSPTVESVTTTTEKRKDFNATTSSIASRPTSNIPSFQRSTKALTDSERCEPLRSRFCTYMGYNQTRLPNLAGHRNQLQAERQISRFLPFIRANCSRALKDFVCATYLPPCSSPQPRTIPPCRELCLKTKTECASLMRAFEFDWPEYLDCQKLPSKQKGKCVMANDRKTPALPTQATQFQRVSGCGGILSRPSGIITTPNFPKPYSPDTLCKWAIILPKVYHVIDIILEEAALEADVNCGYDYLLFLDGLSNQVGPRVCGFLAYPRVITVKGNMAFIVFRSDSALNKKGFLIKYRAHVSTNY